MKEFQEQRKMRNFIFSRPVFIIFLLLTVSLSFSIFKVYKKSLQASLKNDAIETEIQNLETRKKALEENLNRLQTPEGAEEELRQKFQIKKPEEEFIVIIEEEPKQAEQVPGTETKKGLLQKIRDFFSF